MTEAACRCSKVTSGIGDTGFHLGAGLYFGFQGHHHGEWRGELHVDGERIADCTDPAVARDFEVALERIVSEDWPWEHIEEGEENAPTHIRAAFMGPSVVVPVQDGNLALGTWQGIFFCEFDGPRERRVYVTTLS